MFPLYRLYLGDSVGVIKSKFHFFVFQSNWATTVQQSSSFETTLLVTSSLLTHGDCVCIQLITCVDICFCKFTLLDEVKENCCTADCGLILERLYATFHGSLIERWTMCKQPLMCKILQFVFYHTLSCWIFGCWRGSGETPRRSLSHLRHFTYEQEMVEPACCQPWNELGEIEFTLRLFEVLPPYECSAGRIYFPLLSSLGISCQYVMQAAFTL